MRMRKLKGVWQADVSIRKSEVFYGVSRISEQLDNYNGGKNNHRSVLFTYR